MKKNILHSILILAFLVSVLIPQNYIASSPRIPFGQVQPHPCINGPDSLEFETSMVENMDGFPVSQAVVFPKGAVTSLDNLKLKNGGGAEVKAQFDSVVQWPDNSEKSVLVTFLSDRNSSLYTLEYGICVEKENYNTDLSVKKTSRYIVVANNKIKAKINRRNFTIFERLYVDSNENGRFESFENILKRGGGDIILVDNLTGNTFKSSVDQSSYELSVETEGPERIVILAKGKLRAKKGTTKFGDNWLTSFEVRMTFYANTEFIEISYTLIDDKEDHEFPWASGGCKGTNRTKCTSAFEIKELKLKLPLKKTKYHYTFGGENDVYTGSVHGEHYLKQVTNARYSDSDGGFSYNFAYSGVSQRSKAKGWVDVSNRQRGISAGIKNFWQEAPFQLSINKNNLEIILQPAPSPGIFEETFNSYYPGLAKTFDVFLYPHKGNSRAVNIDKINANFQKDPVLLIPTEWYSATKVFGPLVKSDGSYPEYDTKMSNTLDYQQRDGAYIDKTKRRIYGKRDFGDYQLGNGPAYGNGHYEDARGQLLQFLRTGNREWFDMSKDFSKHHMDLDVRHVGGDDYFYDDQVPGMIIGHSYEHEVNSHTEVGHFVPSLTEFYLLTGDQRMLEVIKEQGNFVCEMVKQTDRTDISKGRTFEYERGHAWLLHTLLQTFEATNDEKYLDCAGILMDDVMEWWQESQDHQECAIDSDSELAFYERSDWEQGTGYFIPTSRMANDSHEKNDICGRVSSPWMGAILLTSVTHWYDIIEDHYNGQYVFTDISEPDSPSVTIHNDIDDETPNLEADVKEMINQTLNHITKYGWMDKEYFDQYPDHGYPWTRELADSDDYPGPRLIYSPCTIRVSRYPTSHDGEQYLFYVLLYASKLPGMPEDRVVKWRYIADEIYEQEIRNESSPKWGYYGASWLTSSVNAIALKKALDD